MQILVVTPFYLPDLGPSAPLFTMLCEDLVSMKHKVTVLATVPHFPSGFVKPNYRRGLWQWEICNGVRVCRVRIPSGDRKNLLHRLMTFVIYQILVSVIGLSLKYDKVIITNPAIETGLPFALLVWLKRRPAILCVWDLYPEVGIQLGIFRHKALIRLIRVLEDFCLQRSKVVQVLGEGFLPNLQKRVNPTTQIVVSPPWLDTDFIRPLPRQNAFSEDYHLSDDFVVLYAGNLGLSQGLENVLLAARSLETHQDIKFVFVGDGPDKERLVALGKQWNLQNVSFIPFQPRERLPEVLATADVSLVNLKPGIGDGSLPSKTFPILASGRPIIASADKDSGIWKLIQQSRAGVCVSSGDSKALAHAILALSQDSTMRQEMGANARAYALRYHSRKSAACAFNSVLSEMTAVSSEGVYA